MGGPQSTTTVGQATTVIACLDDTALDQRVRSALVAAGFEVTDATDMTEVGAANGDGPTVLVFDELSEDWLAKVARLTDDHPEIMPFLLAEFDNPDTCLSALSAGVAGFCHVDASCDAIVRAVRSMIDDGVAIPRTMVAPLVEEIRRGRGHVVHMRTGTVVVTDREWDILQMVVQRRSTREMADALFVSVGTVRSHVSALLRKLGAADRDDLVALVKQGNGTSSVT